MLDSVGPDHTEAALFEPPQSSSDGFDSPQDRYDVVEVVCGGQWAPVAVGDRCAHPGGRLSPGRPPGGLTQVLGPQSLRATSVVREERCERTRLLSESISGAGVGREVCLSAVLGAQDVE